MKRILMCLLIPLMVFTACRTATEKEKKTTALIMPSWLAGTWISNSDSIAFIEKWMIVNDSLYGGEGFAIKGNDTLFSEQLEIKRMNDTIFYIPTVSEQNSGKSVQFKFTSSTNEGFTAVNHSHDFPKEISYTLKGDSLYAVLTGVENGRERREIFAMKKAGN